MNVAPTVLSLFIVTATDEPVPLASPDHPVNVELGSEVALRSTVVPASNVAVHVAPQKIPNGFDVTVPEPVRFIVNVYFVLPEVVDLE